MNTILIAIFNMMFVSFHKTRICVVHTLVYIYIYVVCFFVVFFFCELELTVLCNIHIVPLKEVINIVKPMPTDRFNPNLRRDIGTQGTVCIAWWPLVLFECSNS